MRVARSILAFLIVAFGYLSWYSWTFTPTPAIYGFAMLFSPPLCLAAIITLCLTFLETKVSPAGRITYNPKNFLWKNILGGDSMPAKNLSLCSTFWRVMFGIAVVIFSIVVIFVVGALVYAVALGKVKLGFPALLILSALAALSLAIWLKEKKNIAGSFWPLALVGAGCFAVFVAIVLLTAESEHLSFGMALLLVLKMMGIYIAGAIVVVLIVVALFYLGDRVTDRFGASELKNIFLAQWLIAIKTRACPLFFAEEVNDKNA